MNVNRRLEDMRERLERSMPCVMTFMLKNGKTIKADPAAAWNILRDHMPLDDVDSVTADKPEYAAAAGIMTVLCHPAPNRRIEDYE